MANRRRYLRENTRRGHGRTQAKAFRTTVIRARAAADRIRAKVNALAGEQEGLVSEEQISRLSGRRDATVGLAVMGRRGELRRVMQGIWVHTATGRSPDWDLKLVAQAGWLALEPRSTVWERRRRMGPADIVPVIGGAVAWRLWTTEPLAWESILHLAPLQPGRESSSDIVYRRDPIDPVDVFWEAGFPYVRPEALLARAYEDTGDLDRVASAFSEVASHLRPFSAKRFKQQLEVVCLRNGWLDETHNADRIFAILIARAGSSSPTHRLPAD